MSDLAVNGVIDRLTSDKIFFQQVLVDRESALHDYELTPREKRELLSALDLDADAEGDQFSTIRTVARFGPLFAAASASTTKVG